jgi:hypothetical protein
VDKIAFGDAQRDFDVLVSHGRVRHGFDLGLALLSQSAFERGTVRLEGPSAEGSHIPILLAQAKAFERPKWSRIKSSLEDFGKQSGLFKKGGYWPQGEKICENLLS